MNERIKELRKSLNMTQSEFSAKIGLSRNFIAQIETGTKVPSDRTISDICREFKINEEWLRDGKGPMYKERDGSFTELLSDLDDSDDDFIKSIIKIYMDLDEDSKKALRKIAKGLAEKNKGQD